MELLKANWGAYLFILFAPLSVFFPLIEHHHPEILPIYITPGIYLSDLPVFVLLIGSIVRKDKKGAHPKPRYWMPLLFIVGLSIISVPFAISSNLAIYTSLRWLIALILIFVLTRDKLSIPKMVTLFSITLLIHVLIGIGQVLTQSPLGIPGELALDLSSPNVAAIRIADQWWLRAYGLTFHPNVLGGYLIAGLITTVPQLKHPVMRLIWWILFIGLILSFSRSAWLAAIIILIPMCIWIALRFSEMRRPILITGFGVLAIGILALITFQKQITARLDIRDLVSEYSSLAGRGELIEISFTEIRQNPLTGIGAGNFPLAMLNYDTLDPPHYVHNLPLLFASELGIIGGILWFLFWLSPGFKLNPSASIMNLWSITTIGAWLALGFIGLWDSYPWALNSGRLLLVILLSWVTLSLQHTSLEHGRV
jgi:hypothetical protein